MGWRANHRKQPILGGGAEGLPAGAASAAFGRDASAKQEWPQAPLPAIQPCHRHSPLLPPPPPPAPAANSPAAPAAAAAASSPAAPAQRQCDTGRRGGAPRATQQLPTATPTPAASRRRRPGGMRPSPPGAACPHPEHSVRWHAVPCRPPAYLYSFPPVAAGHGAPPCKPLA